jgi:hypothetical protein
MLAWPALQLALQPPAIVQDLPGWSEKREHLLGIVCIVQAWLDDSLTTRYLHRV